MQGEFLWGSNYTFLVLIDHNDAQIPAVYKPTRGVRPLWDFPQTSLPRREVAAYLVSEALGWELVPPTTFREDGPMGPGSLQLYIEHDPEYHYFKFSNKDIQRLRPTVIFDVLINNADRKGSHLIFDEGDHLWLIDHGVCFHKIDKLRTVIWDFIGQTLPDQFQEDLLSLRSKLNDINGNRSLLADSISAHLNSEEIEAIAMRLSGLIASGCFPSPDPDRRHYPWPQI